MKHTVTLSNGATAPALGQGTWYLGDAPETYAREVDALRAGIEAGMTLIDTRKRELRSYGRIASPTRVSERPSP